MLPESVHKSKGKYKEKEKILKIKDLQFSFILYLVILTILYQKK